MFSGPFSGTGSGAPTSGGDLPITTIADNGKVLTVVGGVATFVASPSADARASQSFTNATSLTFAHNLGKRPAIRVYDAGGDEWVVTVQHIDDNTAALSWGTPLTGTAFAN